jgi:hypothetical protein
MEEWRYTSEGAEWGPETEKSLALPEIEPQFLDRPTGSLVTIPTGLTRIHMFRHTNNSTCTPFSYLYCTMRGRQGIYPLKTCCFTGLWTGQGWEPLLFKEAYSTGYTWPWDQGLQCPGVDGWWMATHDLKTWTQGQQVRSHCTASLRSLILYTVLYCLGTDYRGTIQFARYFSSLQ